MFGKLEEFNGEEDWVFLFVLLGLLHIRFYRASCSHRSCTASHHQEHIFNILYFQKIYKLTPSEIVKRFKFHSRFGKRGPGVS